LRESSVSADRGRENLERFSDAGQNGSYLLRRNSWGLMDAQMEMSTMGLHTDQWVQEASEKVANRLAAATRAKERV
jgi:hypothetical protein